ncbi:hypothetical protein FVEG_16282 [Fusarium verticillioides 7600]|uniref:Uncharacterized protein n=1 Tax=Gibberella moniliformis (strain M3125 / FGSC 7600) TaxID=334819 RepID=W7MLZ6_GIBM7|nr:hypothetical protein FVEG_16282 [Fusarium verticillioides 7600]EWG48560.1 hypothetical protein FVEG_16282 [Fusarium verticillioides 7600]
MVVKSSYSLFHSSPVRSGFVALRHTLLHCLPSVSVVHHRKHIETFGEGNFEARLMRASEFSKASRADMAVSTEGTGVFAYSCPHSQTFMRSGIPRPTSYHPRNSHDSLSITP